MPSSARTASSDVTEATLPGHLRGDEEGLAGYTPGDVLDGEAPVNAALAELKKLAVTARARPTAVPR